MQIYVVAQPGREFEVVARRRQPSAEPLMLDVKVDGHNLGYHYVMGAHDKKAYFEGFLRE